MQLTTLEVELLKLLQEEGKYSLADLVRRTQAREHDVRDAVISLKTKGLITDTFVED